MKINGMAKANEFVEWFEGIEGDQEQPARRCTFSRALQGLTLQIICLSVFPIQSAKRTENMDTAIIANTLFRSLSDSKRMNGRTMIYALFVITGMIMSKRLFRMSLLIKKKRDVSNCFNDSSIVYNITWMCFYLFSA